MGGSVANLRTGSLTLPRGTLADRVVARSRRRVAVDAALVVAGAALLALATQVRIPLGFTPVPITGQTFAVLLVGCALGPLRGPLSVALYTGAGVAGAPVFSEGSSGLAHLVGPTGGYLIGFVVAAAALGWLARHGADRRVSTAVGAMALGTLVIYVLGVSGLMAATGVGLSRAVARGVVPFLGVDVLKAGLAALVMPAAWAAVARADGRAGSGGTGATSGPRA